MVTPATATDLTGPQCNQQHPTRRVLGSQSRPNILGERRANTCVPLKIRRKPRSSNVAATCKAAKVVSRSAADTAAKCHQQGQTPATISETQSPSLRRWRWIWLRRQENFTGNSGKPKSLRKTAHEKVLRDRMQLHTEKSTAHVDGSASKETGGMFGIESSLVREVSGLTAAADETAKGASDSNGDDDDENTTLNI